MASREIHVISWDKAMNILPHKDRLTNKNFLEIMTEVSNILKEDKNDYVYQMRLNFGDLIIDKGKMFIGDFMIKGDGYIKNSDDFRHDISYSEDPLGIVLTNHIEVYTENNNLGKSGGKYTLPLNILYPGDLFGVFGTLDMFSQIIEDSSSRDWYARAGNVSFCIAFPFHNKNEMEFLEKGAGYKYVSGMDVKSETIPGDIKIEFIKEFVDDWHVDIAYIPNHYFSMIPENLRLKFENALYDFGWKQSAPLRNALFEDTTIFDIISNPKKKNFTHDKNFLSIVYNYLYYAHKGDALVLKPLTDKHIIRKALDRFKEVNYDYFGSKDCIEPLPFIFGKIDKEKKDWGMVSVNHFPIIYNYWISSLNRFLKDIEEINISIDDSDLQDKEKYKFSHIEGFGNTGNRKKGIKKVQKNYILRNMLADVFQVKPSKINLNSREFSNSVLIRNSIT